MEEPGSISRGAATTHDQGDPPEDRGAEAPPTFPVLLTASLVSSLIVCGSNIVAFSLPWMGRSLEAFLAVVRWAISAYVLILLSECETARMRAELPQRCYAN